MGAKSGSDEVEYTIRPENSAPTVDTSQWPLLLKNYDKRKLLLEMFAQAPETDSMQSLYEPGISRLFPAAAIP